MTKWIKYTAILLFSFGLFSACKKEVVSDEITESPLIKDFSPNRSVLNFSDEEQKLYLTFRVFDLDKDLGITESDTNIVIEEMRSDTLYRRHRLGFPLLDLNILKKDYLEALVSINLPSYAFTPRTDSLHIAERKDTFYIRMFIIDDAGHKSNVVSTRQIYIRD